MKRDEPMLDLVGGDIGMSRHLSKALNIIAGSPTVDKDLKAQIQGVLTGRSSLRDLAQSEPFQRLSDVVVPKALADFAAKSPEEIQRLGEQGNAIFERYRHEDPNTPPTPEPPHSPPPAQYPPPGTPSRATSQTSGNNFGGPAGPALIPGTRKPNRDQVVTPDEPDDDDLYYRERRQGGWFE